MTSRRRRSEIDLHRNNLKEVTIPKTTIIKATTNKTILTSSLAATVLAISGCADHGGKSSCPMGGFCMTGAGGTPIQVTSELGSPSATTTISAQQLSAPMPSAGMWRAISGYLCKTDAFDQALGDFALAYADQTVRDHATLVAAAKAGRIKAMVEKNL